jgi:type I restriction enzyme S subunit
VKLVPIRELATFKHGGTPSKANAAYWRGDIPWVSPKDMKRTAIDDAADHISAEAVTGSAASIVPIGSILIVVRSGILAHSLPVAQATKPLAFNQDIKAVLPKTDAVDADYLFWFLRAQEPSIIARGVKKGATVHSVQSGFIESLLVPLPELPEQRRIVDLLTRAEGIVRLRREAAAKAAELIPAIFIDMFGDPATNPKGWPALPLGSVATVQGGLQVTRAREVLPLERPYLRVANVHRGRLDLAEVKSIRLTDAEFQRTRLEMGDLLFVEGHGNPEEVGRVAVWDASVDGCTHQNHLIRARTHVDQLLPAYACTLLNTPGGRQSLLRAGKTTSGLSTISTKNVKEATVMLPPIDRQGIFVKQAQDASSIARLQVEAMVKAQATFNALLAQAFSPATSATSTQA